MTTRFEVYRRFLRYCISPILRVILKRKKFPLFDSTESSKSSRVSRIWFHAASVGELETLWPVIDRVRPSSELEVLITVLSRSALDSVSRLKVELQNQKVNCIYAGLSPLEGEWMVALKNVSPSVFITVKAEAWPELWGTLSFLGVPFWIVGARNRSSFSLARKVLRVLGAESPKITFCCDTEEDRLKLGSVFPEHQHLVLGDPRWERVWKRSQRENLRVQELKTLYDHLPRPWGVLGSVWPEDLEVLGRSLLEKGGTLWIVPHEVEELGLEKIEFHLRKMSLKWIRTSQSPFCDSGHLLLDEKGFLLELYQLADWVYVGGGFGKGIHSTMEPVVQGVPVSCGPNQIEKFSEVGQFLRLGLLEVVRNRRDLSKWLLEVEPKMEKLKLDLNASQRFAESFEKRLNFGYFQTH